MDYQMGRIGGGMSFSSKLELNHPMPEAGDSVEGIGDIVNPKTELLEQQSHRQTTKNGSVTYELRLQAPSPEAMAAALLEIWRRCRAMGVCVYSSLKDENAMNRLYREEPDHENDNP